MKWDAAPGLNWRGFMPRIAFFLVNKPGICASHTSGFVSSMHVAAWIMQQLWHYELRYIYIIIYIWSCVYIYLTNRNPGKLSGLQK